MVRVSVIVPNLHSSMVGRTLDSLRGQSSPNLSEIIVVGQDRFRQVREDERVRFIVTERPERPAVARNIGIKVARGDILAFIDADCVAVPDWLSQLVAHYRDPEVMVVGGSVDFPTDDYWALCDNLATFHDYLASSAPGTREQLPSLNLSLRASVLNEVGLFDERYPYAAGEDADLTTRLRLHGYVLYFEPRAKVVHYPQRRGVAALFRHAYNFGRYSVKVDSRYQDALQVPVPLRHWLTTLLLSPVLATGVVGSIVFRNRVGLRCWATLPVIFAIKLAWCVGAARTLRRGVTFD